MTHPPGTIAIPCNDLGRYHAFTSSLASLIRPEGSSVAMAQSISIPANLNDLIAGMLSRPDDAWIFFLGDDMAFEPTALMRLLEHEVDVVVPLVPRRRPPFMTVLYKERESGLVPMSFGEVPVSGLITVPSAGTGGMLAKREVFERIEPPWFTYGADDMATEDIGFCERLSEAGYPVHVDTSVRMGHCGVFIAWPGNLESGEWAIALQLGPRPEDSVLLKPGQEEILD